MQWFRKWEYFGHWKEKTLYRNTTKRCSSNLCLAAIIKIIQNCLRRSQIFKKMPFKLHFKVYSKPFIKIIGIFLLTVRSVKSSDQTFTQITRKNRSNLMFLILNFNASNCFTGTYLKRLQHLRWRSLWHY